MSDKLFDKCLAAIAERDLKKRYKLLETIYVRWAMKILATNQMLLVTILRTRRLRFKLQ
jgi:hypothetical protein